MMESGLEASVVGEIKVLCNQKTLFILSDRPQLLVFCAAKLFRVDGFNIVSHAAQCSNQPHRHVFIKFNPHATFGIPGTGRSSSAEAAAKAITAITCSSLSAGKSLQRLTHPTRYMFPAVPEQYPLRKGAHPSIGLEAIFAQQYCKTSVSARSLAHEAR